MNAYSNISLDSAKVMEDKDDYKPHIQMDLIMKKLFTIRNPRPIIDFINAIYGDDISYNAKISYSDKEIINRKRNYAKFISFYADMYLTITDGNKIYEYAMEFQTVFDKEISVRVFRYSFERAVKIIDLSKTRGIIKLKMPEPYIILLEEAPDVPDSIKLQMEFSKGKLFTYDIKVLKYWTYDLEKLYRDNMYLLYPLQIFKLRKSMSAIKSSNHSEKYKETEMNKLHKEMLELIEKTLKAIDKAYNDGRIEIEDYDEMTTVIENINAYFINMYGKYSNFEMEVQEMVKSFYDPRIEEKGIEKGKIEGKVEGKAEMLVKLLTKKFNKVPDDYKKKLMKLPEERLETIAIEIFNINDIKEIEKYF